METVGDQRLERTYITDGQGELACEDFAGWYLPAGERHLPEWMATSKHRREVGGRLTYQYNKIERLDGWVPFTRRRVALDVGAHVGLWAAHLAARFSYVVCFEPKPEHFRLLLANLRRQGLIAQLQPERLFAYQLALGAEGGTVGLYTGPASSGDTTVRGDGDVSMETLDTLSDHVEPLRWAVEDAPRNVTVDLLKIDTEGYEERVLLGGERLIRRDRPYVVVEQKGHEETHHGFERLGAVKLLESWGWRVSFEVSGDYFMEPPA